MNFVYLLLDKQPTITVHINIVVLDQKRLEQYLCVFCTCNILCEWFNIECSKFLSSIYPNSKKSQINICLQSDSLENDMIEIGFDRIWFTWDQLEGMFRVPLGIFFHLCPFSHFTQEKQWKRNILLELFVRHPLDCACA